MTEAQEEKKETLLTAAPKLSLFDFFLKAHVGWKSAFRHISIPSPTELCSQRQSGRKSHYALLQLELGNLPTSSLADALQKSFLSKHRTPPLDRLWGREEESPRTSLLILFPPGSRADGTRPSWRLEELTFVYVHPETLNDPRIKVTAIIEQGRQAQRWLATARLFPVEAGTQ